MTLTKFLLILKGGKGSGNFGHTGRPGKKGGSSSRSGGNFIQPSPPNGVSSSPENLTKNAILAYTKLSDYSSKDLKDLIGTKDYENFKKNTQKELSKIYDKELQGSHLTQNIKADPDKINQVIEFDDVFSLTEGVGPKEYENYKYEIVISGIPISKVIAHSKVNPELFPLASEQEFITEKLKIKINRIYPDERKVHATVISDDTPLGGGVDMNEPDWWKAFLVK